MTIIIATSRIEIIPRRMLTEGRLIKESNATVPFTGFADALNAAIFLFAFNIGF